MRRGGPAAGRGPGVTQYINLYPAALREARPFPAAKHVALACLIAAAIVFGWSRVAVSRAGDLAGQIRALDARLAAEREQITALGRTLGNRKPDAALATALGASEAQLARRQEVLALLEGGSIGTTAGFADVLRGFARQSMPGLWLTGFDVAAGGAELTINGRALHAELVPQYIRRLNAEKVFQGRSFAALKLAPAQAGSTGAATPENTGARGAEPAFVEFGLSGAPVRTARSEARP
jgi:MSHA biogenesis protein MshI